MLVQRAFKYRLQPTPEQAALMRRYAGATRFVYNRALALQEERHADGQKQLSYKLLCRELTKWRHDPDLNWLGEIPVHPLQQAFKDLRRAYTNFFEGRAAHPAFRRKGQHASFRFPDRTQFQVDEGTSVVRLPKLGQVRYRNSRGIGRLVQSHAGKTIRVSEIVRNVTVSEKCGRWYASIQVQYEIPDLVHASDSAVGIDLGVNNLAALSIGETAKPLNAHQQTQTRRAKLQKQLKHKTKGSRNWQKLKAKIARVDQRAANQRRDQLHKLSSAICKNHALIAIENLLVTKITASAKGTLENPGVNVKQKTGLNRSILDQGWGEFRRQLDYKSTWAGGVLVTVNPAFTSQRCSRCGFTDAQSRKTQSEFCCVSCGHSDNADVNAAQNILQAAFQNKIMIERQDTGDASPGCGAPATHSRDSLWIEPHQRPQAGTRNRTLALASI